MVMTGVASPAVAAATSAESSTAFGSAIADGGDEDEDEDECRPKSDPRADVSGGDASDGDDECHHGGQVGPPGPPGPAGPCVTVTSTLPNNNEEFLGALFNGQAYYGRRDLAGGGNDAETTNITNGANNAAGWGNLSTITGYPSSPVCGLSVSSNGSDVYYKIITTDGDVFTLHCAANGQSLVCPATGSQWREVTDLPDSPLADEAPLTGLRALDKGLSKSLRHS
jgi:hypothetical protein